MRVLVIGGGAREHALVARLSADRDVAEVLCIPGNPGMAQLSRCIRGQMDDLDGLVALARQEQVDLTVVGPELPLSLGIADRFAEEGLLIFGPQRAAARLESSKAFAKTFMARHLVPTARFRTCTAVDEALTSIRSGEFGMPVVIKADGLAAGKGVVVAGDRTAAESAVTAAMSERRFGSAGDVVVIEECLTGPEVSFFVISDGERAVPIGTAQDHKRIFDEDRGPNTGGMGAFAPSPLIDRAMEDRIMRDIVTPVIDGMAAEGNPFEGFLFAGLMLTAAGPQVIEFNVRLGAPGSQVVLPLIEEPLLPMLIDAADGRLREGRCRIASERLVGVVLASRGYPESSESGRVIDGVGEAERIAKVFHAGTAIKDGSLVTA